MFKSQNYIPRNFHENAHILRFEMLIFLNVINNQTAVMSVNTSLFSC